jgi:hypothetical protein
VIENLNGESYSDRTCVMCHEVLGYTLTPGVKSIGLCCSTKADRSLEGLYCKACRKLIGYAPYRLLGEICEECG